MPHWLQIRAPMRGGGSVRQEHLNSPALLRWLDTTLTIKLQLRVGSGKLRFELTYLAHKCHELFFPPFSLRFQKRFPPFSLYIKLIFELFDAFLECRNFAHHRTTLRLESCLGSFPRHNRNRRHFYVGFGEWRQIDPVVCLQLSQRGVNLLNWHRPLLQFVDMVDDLNVCISEVAVSPISPLGTGRQILFEFPH